MPFPPLYFNILFQDNLIKLFLLFYYLFILISEVNKKLFVKSRKEIWLRVKSVRRVPSTILTIYQYKLKRKNTAILKCRILILQITL